MTMYDGFKQARIQASDPEVQINLRYRGSGPPVLLLHGCPLPLAPRHLVGLTSLLRCLALGITSLRGRASM